MLKELQRLVSEQPLIIVEGKNDKIALEKLGLKNIITLKKPLYQVAEEITVKKIVILTDLDSAGKKIYSKLRRDLSQRGVTIDNRFRNFLFRYTKLRQIEGLANYVERNG